MDKSRFFTFQPSEIAKLAIILFCAYEMDRNHKKIVGKSINRSKFADGVKELSGGHIVVYNSFLQLLFYALVITVTAGLVYLENHLSGTILILAIGVIMMYLGEIKRHWFVLIAVIAAVAIIIFVLNPQLLENTRARELRRGSIKATTLREQDGKPTTRFMP